MTDDDWIPARQASLFGFIERGGVGGEVTACGLALIADVGPHPAAVAAGLSQLELFLAGGAAVGIPGLSGFTPDVDIDGDGIERFVTDDEHHITSCVDGDGTVFHGRDCWSDPRMADAFSVTAVATYVGAGFAGREPDWESLVEGECVDPPEESLFDPT